MVKVVSYEVDAFEPIVAVLSDKALHPNLIINSLNGMTQSFATRIRDFSLFLNYTKLVMGETCCENIMAEREMSSHQRSGAREQRISSALRVYG